MAWNQHVRVPLNGIELYRSGFRVPHEHLEEFRTRLRVYAATCGTFRDTYSNRTGWNKLTIADPCPIDYLDDAHRSNHAAAERHSGAAPGAPGRGL